MTAIPDLLTVEENGQWFVVGPWDEPCGPYKTKSEAEEDRRGMERTYRYHEQPGFITCLA